MPIFNNRYGNTGRRSGGGRLIIAGVLALMAIIGYYARTSTNPVTGKKQHISLTPQQEVAIGLQAAPEMAREFGGLSNNSAGRAKVASVGQRLVGAIPKEATPYPYEFHLLDDDRTVNAFALPGGQIFITDALFNQLTSDGQLAGVLGHEIGHVIGRHSAERMAKSELTQGLVGAVGVAASDGGGSGQSAAAVAAMVGNMITLKYGRVDELESDELGIRIMAGAGFDPRSMIGVMEILKKASGGGSRPEFASTHPDPGHRIEEIQKIIQKNWPQGVPDGLEK